MYGYDSLKSQILLSEGEVECPVKNCSIRVPRQRRVFRKEDKFKCPTHNIYLSASTFEYETEFENLLWNDSKEREYFKQIKKIKRESRIVRENSEDAVSYNVIRYLKRNDLINPFLSKLESSDIKDSELILWSYSEKENGHYSLLNRARVEFGETISRGSEPDIIVQTNKTLFFIEAKVLALNETKPSNLNSTKKYLTGGNEWYQKVFRQDYHTVAIAQEKYELLRFWLLGTWMATQIGLNFSLISLVLDKREQDIETSFNKLIVSDNINRFFRISWEDIYKFIVDNKISSEDFITIINYYQNKCLGYNENQNLIKAFSTQRS